MIYVEEWFVLGPSDFEVFFTYRGFPSLQVGFFPMENEQEFKPGFPVKCSGCWFKAALRQFNWGQFNEFQLLQSH